MQKPLDYKSSPAAALAIRSAALFGILFQYNFLAGDLSDTSIFIPTICCALIAGQLLFVKHIQKTAAVFIILLSPFAARLLLAFPRWTSSNLHINIALDALLLGYDRNNLVTLLPFYYAGITTRFAAASRNSLRNTALLDCTLIALTFSIARSSDIAFYSLPVVLLAVFGVLTALELAVLVLSIPKNSFINKKETACSFALLFCFFLAGSLVFMYQVRSGNFGGGSGAGHAEGTVPAGKGLIRPDLFSFDMTPYLNLHTEVSMGNDLVFIVRKDKPGNHILLRRFVLSAYNSIKKGDVDAGFTRSETIDEKNQRSEIPSGSRTFQLDNYKKRETLKQEYYIKNIDGASLLAMNEPAVVTPFDNYDASSFKSVYEVESKVSIASPQELYFAAEEYLDDPNYGLNPEEFAWYTSFANGKDGITATEQKIKNLAEELTASYNDNFSKTIILLSYFTEGDFRYSLKPGIAEDGDQLNHFLFKSKRGYCSYFAYAYATMLRALAIPSRVAVGFYIDPETERFGFYPVRSSNAHAWVEVYFPQYGWIEFDPTTQVYAEDELEPTIGGLPEDNLEQLMKEILENRDKLKAKSKLEEDDDNTNFTQIIKNAAAKLQPVLLPFLAAFLLCALAVMRWRWYLAAQIAKNPRKKTTLLWHHILLRLRLAGYKRTLRESEAEWIATLPCSAELGRLYTSVERARYAPEYSASENTDFALAYTQFSKTMRQYRKKKTKTLLILIVFSLLPGYDSANTQELESDPNVLYDAADEAVRGEFWERAIALYNQGKKQFSDDWRFPLALGDLYFSKELYRLAKEEYFAAYQLVPDYLYIIYKLALTAGSLNENTEAAKYFERYLEFNPDDIDVVSELGWMYFKLHRLEEGEALLLSAIQTHGASRRLAMTLATIYSDMLNYTESSRWYRAAINASTSAEVQYNSSNFAATAYYNYAILESRFYNYETAFDLAQSSLNMADRDTGHMMRGELFLRRYDFTQSVAEYSRAFEMDKQSPLPKVSLAQVFLITGRLEEARLYAEDCFKATNHAWMFRFGIDPDQYARDLHEILYKAYLGLYHKEKLTVHGSIKQKWNGFIKQVVYQFRHIIHKKLYQKYSLITAHSYNIDAGGGQYLEALSQYYNAFMDYRGRAAFYLKHAAAYETELIPRSLPTYLYEKGKLEKNAELSNEAFELFDPLWERDMKANALVDLYHSAYRNAQHNKAYTTAETLYLLNPGALRQNLVRLPVKVTIEGAAGTARKKIVKTIARTGFYPQAGQRGENCRFSLNLTISGSLAQVSLYDQISGTALLRRNIQLPDYSSASLASFAATLADTIFEVR